MASSLQHAILVNLGKGFEQQKRILMQGYITISFSYVYLNGLHLGIGPSSPVVIEVHLLNLSTQKNCTQSL